MEFLDLALVVATVVVVSGIGLFLVSSQDKEIEKLKNSLQLALDLIEFNEKELQNTKKQLETVTKVLNEISESILTNQPTSRDVLDLNDTTILPEALSSEESLELPKKRRSTKKSEKTSKTKRVASKRGRK